MPHQQAPIDPLAAAPTRKAAAPPTKAAPTKAVRPPRDAHIHHGHDQAEPSRVQPAAAVPPPKASTSTAAPAEPVRFLRWRDATQRLQLAAQKRLSEEQSPSNSKRSKPAAPARASPARACTA